MDSWIGYYTIFCGVVHNAVGLMVPGLRKPLFAVLRDGFVNKVDPHYDRFATIFFQVMGFWWMILGYVLILLHPYVDPFPHALGWAMILLTAFTVMAMPKSGFWAFFVPGFWIVLT